jgi:hypothetical protein
MTVHRCQSGSRRSRQSDKGASPQLVSFAVFVTNALAVARDKRLPGLACIAHCTSTAGSRSKDRSVKQQPKSVKLQLQLKCEKLGRSRTHSSLRKSVLPRGARLRAGNGNDRSRQQLRERNSRTHMKALQRSFWILHSGRRCRKVSSAVWCPRWHSVWATIEKPKRLAAFTTPGTNGSDCA